MAQLFTVPKRSVLPQILVFNDPKLVEYIAHTRLEDPVCYSKFRNMLGYSGHLFGLPVSLQSLGIGMPSSDIVLHELMEEYNVKTAIYLGQCCSLSDRLQGFDVLIADSACTDSQMNRQRMHGDYAPSADFDLLHTAYHRFSDSSLRAHIGSVLTSDLWDTPARCADTWAHYGVYAKDMTTSALYARAAQHSARALSLLAILHSDTTPSPSYADWDSQSDALLSLAIGILQENI